MRTLGPWLVAALALSAGCAGSGIEFAELPEAEIAFFYRTPESSERRAELLARAEEKETGGRSDATVVRLEDVGSYLGLLPQGLDALREMQGTLAFLDPRTRTVRSSEAAVPGARPLEWSRDHRRLLFQATGGDGRLQLHEVDVTTGDVHVLTRGPALHPHGSYGPDGRLTFAEAVPIPGRQDATSRVFVTEAGGGLPRPITEGPHDLRPGWAPDGRSIVYTTRGPDGDRIARVAPEGGTPQILARGQDPAFSPDGAWIVYSAKTRKGLRLWRMRPDGSGKLPVGAGVTDEFDPVFSPDGRFVLFVVEELHRQRLVVRRLDGSAERVLFDDGGGSSPTW